jgi:sugar O-acyltransferase (sialic acid O-acetyltransferase NeuD family)
MGRLLILGTGGMGRETAAWAADAGHGEHLAGFLDMDPEMWGREIAGLPVLGDFAEVVGRHDVSLAVAIGNSEARRSAVAALDEAGIPLATIVHPTATIGPRVTIEDGAIICPQVFLSCDVTVGRAAIVNYGARIGHDGVIGACAFIAPGAHLAGNVTVGDQAQIGIGASVIQGVEIGKGAVVGAGAAVIRDVEPETTVVGVPARPIRTAEA